ncbi:hypothetical protein [Rhodococcus maanshanensis]|uniref:Mce-associated membrane protein n=1 Tax=Rhodococcus maanshanensis TaxID=183556 RepID=A0A1H7JT35_9NOCA|nr:hypothetical protein [Rhodococcus maanshanensis]SEK76675.1 Mce-associated membrane protein [Rhodococcus maanshanensis]
MPPRRRITSTPQPKGRRPRVAGTGSSAARGTASEPETTAPASSAGTETEVVAAGSGAAGPPAGASVAPAAADTEAAAAEVTATATAAAAEDTEGESAAQEPEQAPKTINRTSSLRPRATGAPDAEVTAAPGSAVDEEAVRAGWKRVTTIGLVAIGLGVFALVAAFRPGADVPNQAWVDTAETSKVTADAKNAIQTLYTYKFDTVEQDFDKARAVLDDAMREEFDRTAAVTKDAVIQTKTATNAEVTDIGLKLLSDDRAELVASMNVSATNDGVAQGSAQGPLSVTMAKSGDNWVITDIRDR